MYVKGERERERHNREKRERGKRDIFKGDVYNTDISYWYIDKQGALLTA